MGDSMATRPEVSGGGAWTAPLGVSAGSSDAAGRVGAKAGAGGPPPRLIVTVSSWSLRSSSEGSFSTMSRTSSLSLRISIMRAVQSSQSGPVDVLGQGAEVLSAVVADDVQVFDAHAALAGQV